jgi:hypothetical protein
MMESVSENLTTIVFVAALVFVGWALVSWLGQPPSGAPHKQGLWAMTQTQDWRAILLVVWAVALPLYFLWEWHGLHSNPPNPFQPWQYGRKLVSDVWAAVAVLLAFLFGVKKP